MEAKLKIVNDDTIAAISTSPGEGGIGIVRMSGADSLNILLKLFAWTKGELNKDIIIRRRMYYGKVLDENSDVIDEVLTVYMEGPNTYTGEDIVEINCHGSMVALRKTLTRVLSLGARLAEPGEFSKRAFLNGKMDLSQAEAVIDLIQAKTDIGYGVALNQLEGKYSSEIRLLRDSALEILSHIIVNIDYPDADIEEITFSELGSSLDNLKRKIAELLESYKVGKIIKDGFNVAITGKPNVGKSSLMNALLKENRAIVTEIPGTTRDAIEEVVNIGGAPVKLIDTAGIRETDDKVEALGIERSKYAFDMADLILVLLDESTGLDDDDKKILEKLGRKPTIICINKIDLASETVIENPNNFKTIKMSMKTGEGLKDLEREIEDMIFSGTVKNTEGTLVTNVRHADQLRLANEELQEAIEMIERKEALDFVEMNIRRAVDHLGEIIGETAGEGILDEVFDRFCLGK